MKNKIKYILTGVILSFIPVLTAVAQPTAGGAPGPAGGTAPTSGNTLGCSAAVGEGYWILLGLAVCYGVYLYWHMKSKQRLA